MPTGLAVDGEKGLKEIRKREIIPQPPVLRVIATVISFIFHPVFVPVYVVGFLVYIHPYLFAGFSDWDKSMKFILAFVNFTFFPLVTVLLLKALQFIESIKLETQRARII